MEKLIVKSEQQPAPVDPVDPDEDSTEPDDGEEVIVIEIDDKKPIDGNGQSSEGKGDESVQDDSSGTNETVTNPNEKGLVEEDGSIFPDTVQIAILDLAIVLVIAMIPLCIFLCRLKKSNS